MRQNNTERALTKILKKMSYIKKNYSIKKIKKSKYNKKIKYKLLIN